MQLVPAELRDILQISLQIATSEPVVKITEYDEDSNLFLLAEWMLEEEGLKEED